MAKISLEQYLKVLQHSKLIERERLGVAFAEVKREAQLTGKANDSAALFELLVKHLLDKELITPWHQEKLGDGKHKGFFLGRYKLLGHIGTGGMSTVYLAEHQLMRRRVAIKVLPQSRVEDSSYLGRFYVESQATAALDHPNIVRAFDVDNEGKIHYMVMEYVDGIDLHQIVERDGALPFPIAADYIRQAALGLQHAHERNMIHRDIKPSNLLCDKQGVIKVLDLGLARITTDKESLTLLHKENVLGTTDYLAPEQALDSHNVDHRADIYSLGCTFYFLLTGRPPFPEGSLAQRLLKHQSEEPDPITKTRSACPAALVEICQKMIAKKRINRYESMAEVAQALQDWLVHQGVDIKADTFADLPSSWSKDGAAMPALGGHGQSFGEPDDDLDSLPELMSKPKRPKRIEDEDTVISLPAVAVELAATAVTASAPRDDDSSVTAELRTMTTGTKTSASPEEETKTHSPSKSPGPSKSPAPGQMTAPAAKAPSTASASGIHGARRVVERREIPAPTRPSAKNSPRRTATAGADRATTARRGPAADPAEPAETPSHEEIAAKTVRKADGSREIPTPAPPPVQPAPTPLANIAPAPPSDVVSTHPLQSEGSSRGSGRRKESGGGSGRRKAGSDIGATDEAVGVGSAKRSNSSSGSHKGSGVTTAGSMSPSNIALATEPLKNSSSVRLKAQARTNMIFYAALGGGLLFVALSIAAFFAYSGGETPKPVPGQVVVVEGPAYTQLEVTVAAQGADFNSLDEALDWVRQAIQAGRGKPQPPRTVRVLDNRKYSIRKVLDGSLEHLTIQTSAGATLIPATSQSKHVLECSAIAQPVVLDGFTLDASGANLGLSLRHDCLGFVCRNAKIINFKVAAVQVEGCTANATKPCVLESVVCQSPADPAAVGVSVVPGVRVTANLILSQMRFFKLQTGVALRAPTQGLEISRCVFSECTGPSVMIADNKQTKLAILNNTFDRSPVGIRCQGLWATSEDVRIKNNLFVEVSTAAEFARRVDDNTVERRFGDRVSHNFSIGRSDSGENSIPLTEPPLDGGAVGNWERNPQSGDYLVPRNDALRNRGDQVEVHAKQTVRFVGAFAPR